MKLCLAGAAYLLTSFVNLSTAAEPTQEPLAKVKENVAQKKAVLVDVREKSEWDKGHVEGAVLLPLTDLQRGVNAEQLQKSLPKDKIVYTHCVVGKRAVTAANILEKLGYEVRPLRPGYQELLQAGFPPAKN
jgi:rhodanese-related sulfurtransferase